MFLVKNKFGDYFCGVSPISARNTYTKCDRGCAMLYIPNLQVAKSNGLTMLNQSTQLGQL